MADNIVIRLQIFLSFHVDSLYKKPRFCFFVFFGGVGSVFVTVVVVFFLFSFSLFSDLREDSCNRFPKRVSR